MTRRAIGLDCDGVLSDFTGYVLRKVNARTGLGLQVEGWTTWWPNDCYGASADREITREISSMQTGWTGELLPIDGAASVVRSLVFDLDYEVHVVTSVSHREQQSRWNWLYRHGFPVDRLHCVGRASKVPTIDHHRMVAFVDDRPETSDEVHRDSSARSYLVETHANATSVCLDGVTRGPLSGLIPWLTG